MRHGAEAIIRLRALRASGDFDAYWGFHEAREHARHPASNTPAHPRLLSSLLGHPAIPAQPYARPLMTVVPGEPHPMHPIESCVPPIHSRDEKSFIRILILPFHAPVEAAIFVTDRLPRHFRNVIKALDPSIQTRY